jgi:hypothetical protein
VASIHAKHSRSCATGRAWTPFAEAAAACSCPSGPLYYVVVRDGPRSDKIRVGRNRKDAQRALRKIAVSVDDGDYQPQLNVRFDDWGQRWLAALERKPSTVRSYRPTIAFAAGVFGRTLVRRLRTEDVSRFNAALPRWMAPRNRPRPAATGPVPSRRHGAT